MEKKKKQRRNMTQSRRHTRVLRSRQTYAKLLALAIFIIWLLYMILKYEPASPVILNKSKHYIEFKYILQWTSNTTSPFNYLGNGYSAFEQNRCKFKNCIIINNKHYFANFTEYDAVIFNGKDIAGLTKYNMPSSRSPKQKYIFVAMESSDNYPVCSYHYDGFFNWTWTYRLDSDFRWRYITVHDLNGTAVGPEVDMKWKKDMRPISNELKEKLSSKKKAAAWFVSNCSTKRKREFFVKQVQRELHNYGLTVDIYGSRCGTFVCPKTESEKCFKKIENDYYFYFAFENSFAEDYVTEKLGTAVINYAVPVVYGEADYSRFLPPDSYLDAIALGPKELARQMKEIIDNPPLYHDFFRWRNHYVYENAVNKDICKLCEMLHDHKKMLQITTWYNFRSWWNGGRYRENCNSVYTTF